MSKPVFEDLFTWSGRRNRKSYIMLSLAMIAIVFVLVLIATLLSGGDPTGSLIVVGIICLPIIVISWAAGAQRCRDFGWTGWAILITAIPYVGFLFALALWFIPGNVGDNRYGPDPLKSY